MQNLAVLGGLMLINPTTGKKVDPVWNGYGIDGVQSTKGKQ
jgi:hypothetical protein